MCRHSFLGGNYENKVTRSLSHSVTRSLIGIGMTALLMSSCNNSPSQNGLFQQAKPVKAIAAEALALTQAIRSGLRIQTAQTLETNHLRTQDLLGNAYGDIIFTTSAVINDPLSYAITIKNKDWSNIDDPAQSTIIVGASTARSILLYRANHQMLISEIGKTVAALGGVNQVGQLVSVNGVDTIWILAKNGIYWSVENQLPVPENQVAVVRANTSKMLSEISASSELVEKFQKQWEPVLEAQTTTSATGQKASVKLDPLAGENPIEFFDDGTGHLNKALFLELAQKSGALSTTGLKPQFNSGFSFCIWFFCVGYNSGGLPESKLLDLSGGYQQNLSKFGASIRAYYSSGQFTIPPFTSGSSTSYNLGCGPASFAGLAWWHWKNSRDAWGNKLNVNSQVAATTHTDSVARYNYLDTGVSFENNDIFYQNLLKPNGAGTPRIAELMGTASVGADSSIYNPSFTWPDNEVFGGSQWLQDQGMDLRMYGVVGYSSYFTFAAGAVAGLAFGPAGSLVGATFGWTADVLLKIGLYTRMGQLIVQDIGQKEIPLIAIYNVNGGGMDFNGLHYSPIREYSITNWLVWPDVQIKTVDTNAFRSISDISLPASGLMGAYQPSKEFAPSLWPGLISWR